MEEIIKCLNEYLADLNVFYRKLQNYHWNIKGKEFFILHEKLEEYYVEINEQVDEVAERILMLGGQPLGTLKDYLENSKIEEAQNKKVEAEIVYQELIKDMEYMLGHVIKLKETVDKNQDYATSSMLDGYIAGYTKKLWMLNQTIA